MTLMMIHVPQEDGQISIQESVWECVWELNSEELGQFNSVYMCSEKTKYVEIWTDPS